LQIELVEQWNKYDFERKQRLKEEYKNLSYKEFSNKYKHSDYEFMHLSDKQIIKNNERDARDLIIDLYYRINRITGKIVNWNDIHYSGAALNGIVTGKEGKAKVESILAGGYNIQRLHIRTLVHSI